MAEIKKRSGFKYVTKLPDTERCVGIIEFKGEVLVATDKSVYKLKDKVLEPISFMLEDNPDIANKPINSDPKKQA